MRYLEYKESRVHGTQEFPFAYYHVTPQHPRYHMVDHWHTEYELIRVLQGTLALTINGTAYTGGPGSLFFISEGMLHSGIPSACEYECLVFDIHRVAEGAFLVNQALAPVLQGAEQIEKSFDTTDLEASKLVGEIMDAMRLREPGYKLRLLGSLYRLFAAILNRYTHTEVPKSADTQQLARLKSVLRYIRSHYSEPISLEALAACAHMNKRYFCRYFRDMTQKTPIEYVNYYRIECACEQLMTTDKNVSEVALACGFNDISYFIRVFKKHKGITPQKYVKSATARHIPAFLPPV